MLQVYIDPCLLIRRPGSQLTTERAYDASLVSRQFLHAMVVCPPIGLGRSSRLSEIVLHRFAKPDSASRKTFSLPGTPRASVILQARETCLRQECRFELFVDVENIEKDCPVFKMPAVLSSEARMMSIDLKVPGNSRHETRSKRPVKHPRTMEGDHQPSWHLHRERGAKNSLEGS
jgi:hypothetical protein